MNKKAYFIGIAGKTMGALAKAFKDLGWEVSGSDHKGVYPPISTYLQDNKIPYIEGYEAKNVPKDADLVVVGRSALMVDHNNPEYLKAKTLGCPVLSYPETLRDFLIKENSIVVAGTYGKTTTSALISCILTKSGVNPSFMTGGVPLDFADGVKITDSVYSVVEGDEPPSLHETDLPKFMFYKPKYLLLTATLHDHPEIYKTPESYQQAFMELVKLLPRKGLLVYNIDNVSKAIVEAAICPVVNYSLSDPKADYLVANFRTNEDKVVFLVKGKNNFQVDLETTLLGKHNLENICSAVALCHELGFSDQAIAQGVKLFHGVKTRLEFLGKINGRYLYWDFAQHPEKVKSTLDALREHYPTSKIWAIFDPMATALKYKESLSWYPGAFDAASEVIVGKVNFLQNIAKEEKVTGADIVRAIAKTQKQVVYEPTDERLINQICSETKEDDVIVFMSSGGLRFVNLIEETIKRLRINC
ncbi:MAG: Mur ligase family protein [Patescibacteria group bacterium]|nr:Mur ligase family protein [Patescibacteria group bacterium]